MPNSLTQNTNSPTNGIFERPTQQSGQGPSPTERDSDSANPFESQADIESEHSPRRANWSICARVKAARRAFDKERDVFKIHQEINSLDDYHPGYGKVAAIEDLDDDFFIYRKFAWLHHYALLHLQDELADFQEELEMFDKWEAESERGDPSKLVSRRTDYAYKDSSRRKKLVTALHEKLAQYDKALLRMQKIQAIKRPTERSQTNLYNLVSNSKSLVEEERAWIRRGPDLAAVGCGPEYGWFNTFIEDVLSKVSTAVTLAIFRTPEQRIKSGHERLNLLSAERLDIFARIILTMVAAILLLFPVFALFRLQPTSQAEFYRKSNYQIGTVFLSTLVFAACCSIFTKARRQEVFTATAAYCAVLVVFLGNTGTIMISQLNP